MNNSAPTLESHRYGAETYASNGAPPKPIQAKIITCRQEGNPLKAGLRVAINSKNYRSFDTLLSELTQKMPEMGHGVRSIYTSRGRNRLSGIDQFENGGHYICCQSTVRRPRLVPKNVKRLPDWRGGKPPSARHAYRISLRNGNSSYSLEPRRAPPPTQYKARSYPGSDTDQSPQPFPVSLYNRVDCKRIIVRKNGEPYNKHVVLINKKMARSFEKIMEDLSDMFQMVVRRLYTLDGEPIESLSAIFNGPEEYIASDTRGLMKTWVGPTNGHLKKRPRARDAMMEETTASQRDKKPRSKGFWNVCVTTRSEADAGSTAHVSLTVYGTRGCSEAIPLSTTVGDGILNPFEAGNKDEFKISVGNIGEVRKIRLAHDNSGPSPSWFVGELLMSDIHSGQELSFRFDRWLSRDHDHGEICRELPAVRAGKPTPSVLNYYVTVYTGDCYNAGTEANVSIILTGESGDTGPRQLWKAEPPKPKLFQNASVDTFVIEAVDLGRPQKLLVAHDAVGAGFGWYLEKVVVKEGCRAEDAEFIFPCNGWLDEGEGFGKTAIELTPTTPGRADKHDEVMWDCEKWKFAPGNDLQFFNKATEKVLRLNADRKVDVLGEERDSNSVFTVVEAHGVSFSLQSKSDPSVVLAFDNGLVTTAPQPNPNTTLRVHVHPNRSVSLFWAKKGHHPFAFNSRGLPVTAGAHASPEGDIFVPYCKGVFRQDGIVMLCTSASQTLSVEHSSVHGTGKKNRMAHFIVHKADEGRVRMFESVVFRDQFLRVKDGTCDCLGTGDTSCHFRVDVFKDRGFVTLHSVAQPGTCIGMAEDGRVMPMTDEGEPKTRFFPEVVRFGIARAPFDVGTPVPADQSPNASPPPSPARRSPRVPTPTAAASRPPSTRRRTPPTAVPEEPQDYRDDEWRLLVESADSASPGASVVVFVYGRSGNSGRIHLGNTESLFKAGNRDEFKINLKDLGDLTKIRVELEPEDWSAQLPHWSLKEISMENPSTSETLSFVFDGAAFSLDEEDGTLAREMSVNGLLPLVRYEVTVVTSDVEDAETSANIFLVLFGENGDSGKRLLRRPAGERAFSRGESAFFVIEAVHLGTLKRCVISHDGRDSGQGWHCGRVTVTDAYEAKEYIFPCERWLDAGQDDAKIERVLRPNGLGSASTVSSVSKPSAKSADSSSSSEPDEDAQMESIRRDGHDETPQELIDDVTERVAKRIEDHHARES